MFFATPAIDLKILLLVNQHWRNLLFDALMPLLSSMPVLLVLMAALLILALRKLGRRQIIYFIILFIGMGLSDYSTKLVKSEINRLRPLNEVAGTYYHEDGAWHRRPPDFTPTKEHGSSYPSAHSSNTMCLAVLAMLIWPALKGWPLILPLLVGYSRLYLGKHFPTDVMAGWLFGAVVAAVVWLVWKNLRHRILRNRTG